MTLRPPTDLYGPLPAKLYDEWKRYGRHLEEYACEFLGTAFGVFCVVGVVAMMFSPASPVGRVMPSVPLRLFVAGLLLGGSGGLVAISPLGRLSGAHLNPAVSLGFWLLGKMHTKDTIGYVFSQMAGGVLGAFLGHDVFYRFAVGVSDASLAPGAGVKPTGAFLAEAATTFVLACIIYAFVSHQSLMRWTPAVVTLAAGVLVCLDGSFSGCGMNPARWLGPAAVTNTWTLPCVYVLGPALGGLAAAALRRSGLLPHPIPHTAKLFHDPGYRSIFKHDQAPSAPPTIRAR